MRTKAFLALLLTLLVAGPVVAEEREGQDHTAVVVEEREGQDPIAEALIKCAPASYEAAVACLNSHLPAETKATLKKMGAVGAHFGLGMWIRNNWGLWKGGKLGRAMNELGFRHPDDMSASILDGLVAKLRGEPFDLSARAAEYDAYWKRASERKEVPCGENAIGSSDKKVRCFIDGNGNHTMESEN